MTVTFFDYWIGKIKKENNTDYAKNMFVVKM